MRHRSAVAAITLVAAAFGTPLLAQDANSDVKCFMASNIFAKAAPDDKGKEAAIRTRLYYLGRIDMRLNHVQLKSALAAQGKTFEMATAAATMNACVERLDASGRAVQEIGQALSKTAGK